MIKQPRRNIVWMLTGGLAVMLFVNHYLSAQSEPPSSAPTTTADSIVIPTEPCQASRQARLINPSMEEIMSGPKKEMLTHRARVTVDDVTTWIYLPEKTPYTLVNTGESDGEFDNTSTLLAIDSRPDKRITDDENWYANLPIRIADRMFDVTAIAEDGSSITLTPSSAPLSGVVVGRKVPPFSYQREDGQLITQDDYKGKAFLLDIWSVT
ncbi:MAG: hypothetical protein HJJLKODD_01126 [Phycisphaerae bacterium]|nr:hypothetical protein [Phycisphaerae bacterium]